MIDQQKKGCETSRRVPGKAGHPSTLRILIADDNPGDVNLIREAIKQCSGTFNISVVQDGKAALDEIERMSGSSLLPDLVFLDLNMPRVDGFGVLASIRKEPRLKEIPVVVFSTSSNPDDARRATELGADRFLTKPNELESYLASIQECCRACISIGAVI